MNLFLLLLASLVSLSAQRTDSLMELQELERQQRESAERFAQVRENLEKQREVNEALARSPEVIAKVLTKHDERLRALEKPGEGAERPGLQRNLDATWLVIAGMLVFFMQAGFGMFEMGLVRAKNSINVVMKNVLDLATVSISYLLIGFTLMFGISEGGFFGKVIWLPGIDGDSALWPMFFFQVVFAATACTIASGAMAERTKFVGYAVYTTIFAGLIYPIFGHWAWGSGAAGLEPGFGGGEGWIEQMGYVDFAGSSVVHAIGGACALAGIMVVGPRKGRFTKDGKAILINGHNMPLVALGAFILWLGWFGFNAGSGLVAETTLGRICVNTLVAGGAGCLSAMVFFWAVRGVAEPTVTLLGAIGGLVGVTAGCGVVNPGSAILIGLVSGVIATAGTFLLERLKLDDVTGAVPVHLFCGIWGAIAVGIFHEEGFSAGRVGIQAVGALLIAVGAFVAAYVIFQTIDTFIGLRASDEEQEDGLDFAEHAMAAYPDFQTAERSSGEIGEVEEEPVVAEVAFPKENPLMKTGRVILKAPVNPNPVPRAMVPEAPRGPLPQPSPVQPPPAPRAFEPVGKNGKHD